MPYARIDDRYDDHRKIKRAWRQQPAAVGLHAMAITYSNRFSTDGVVDRAWIDEKLALTRHKARQRAEILQTLLTLDCSKNSTQSTSASTTSWTGTSAESNAESSLSRGKREGRPKAPGMNRASQTPTTGQAKAKAKA